MKVRSIQMIWHKAVTFTMGKVREVLGSRAHSRFGIGKRIITVVIRTQYWSPIVNFRLCHLTLPPPPCPKPLQTSLACFARERGAPGCEGRRGGWVEWEDGGGGGGGGGGLCSHPVLPNMPCG